MLLLIVEITDSVELEGGGVRGVLRLSQLGGIPMYGWSDARMVFGWQTGGQQLSGVFDSTYPLY